MPPKRIKELTTTLGEKGIRYVVIAGVGLDGKRGHLTRPHQDVDVLCLKDDEQKVEEMIEDLKYDRRRINDLYKLKREDGAKVDLCLVTIEGNEAVTYGRTAVTRFPKEFLEKPQKGHIDDVEFNIAPNEMLRIWGAHSDKGNDAEYAKSLPADEKKMKKVKRVLRE